MDKCIACGICAEKCPKQVPNDYNVKLNKRKASYVYYDQAVPLKYCIDSSNCIFFIKGKCKACQKFCPTGAVQLNEQKITRNINVGSIIISAGLKPFDPSMYLHYYYKKYKNVVTALEFERILAANGPWNGHMVRPSDEKEPRKIAWIQCVGSRDINACDHAYCSAVCCMYAIKEAVLAKEHAHNVDAAIFYMDMRTYGKDFERYYENAKIRGVRFIRSRVHTINELHDQSLCIEYVTENGISVVEGFDMIVLSHGLEVAKETIKLANKLNINLVSNNFVESKTFSPVASSRPGIYICGALAGPKDIPLSVVEASAAACAATSKLSSARGTLVSKLEIPEFLDVKGDLPRIGVFICSCGINIAGIIDVKSVSEYAKLLPNVVYVENNLFTCSQDSQDKIVQTIKDKKLNRIVVAACTPRTHEPLFQETIQNAGLNKYLFEMANIRNQVSWVHVDEPDQATRKARDLIRMSVAKVSLLQPLEEIQLSVIPAAMVVGGGISGMNAALELARHGFKTYLVEREDKLGGNAYFLRTTVKGENVQDYLIELEKQVKAEPYIGLHLNTIIKHVDGFVGNFKTVLAGSLKEEIIEHGIVIIATGAIEQRPNEYLYGQDERIKTHLELDVGLISGEIKPKACGSVVFIQCVGSRESERPYCSKVCCTHAVETALFFKKQNFDCQVYVLYRDIRTFGEREILYKEARSNGVLFIRYNVENKPRVTIGEDSLVISVYDHVLNRKLLINSDLVVLASAIVSYRDESLAQMFKVPLDADGWFLEAHQKLRPVDFATDGVFMAGLAHYPKPLEEAVAQAQAAVSRAITILSRKKIWLSGTVAYVDHDKCVGCGVCWTICPYQAVTSNSEGVAVVNEVLCKGCGSCVASCRSGASNLYGFTTQDILLQIENVM